VGQPARGAGDGEQHGEHVGGEPHRLVDQPGVEVDVGVQAAAHEVVVAQRYLFQLQGDVEQRVGAGHIEHVVGRVFDDAGPGVVVLVHPVAEPHQAGFPGLDRLDERVDVLVAADVVEHLHHGLVGPPVAGAVQAASRGGDHRVGVGVGAAHHPGGAGGAVLAVVGVGDEQKVERPAQGRVALVGGLGDLEHHRQEVGGEIEVVVGIHERQPGVEA